VAGSIAARLGHPARFLFVVMAMTAVLSAFLNHDIVCFVFAPIVGAALLRQRLNPIPFLVGLAIASNVGSATTLIGNAQDMVIGQEAHLSFGRYLLWSIAPVITALAASYGIVWLLSYRNLKSDLPAAATSAKKETAFNRFHTIKGLVILAVVIGLFFSPLPKEMVALAAAGIHLASKKFETRKLLALVDWPVLVLFMGLFVVTGSFQATGYGEQGVRWLAAAGLNLNAPDVLIAATTLLTNTINNSAAVILLLKVLDLSHPTTAYVLALANSFAGSLIIIGSVANIIVVQQARALGIRIGFWDFSRIGIPATLAALAGLLVWVMI
jgi:Na+/H+ antiporter NhaD/arsenite permease-like protein